MLFMSASGLHCFAEWFIQLLALCYVGCCLWFKVKFLSSRYPSINIQVDGGVGPDNIKTCAEV